MYIEARKKREKEKKKKLQLVHFIFHCLGSNVKIQLVIMIVKELVIINFS